jgi:hypothetical protein
MKKINVKGLDIVIFEQKESDYISLTDIARYKNFEVIGFVIFYWFSIWFIVEFMGIWEQMHNPLFNVTEFSNIKNQSGSNGFVLSGKQWIEKTKAIGLVAKTGRYGGGTYAHRDIAFEFASWISAEFKLYLIKEFQRLKEEETVRLSLDWNAKRMLTKINYRIHTDAIKVHLVPVEITKTQANMIYATEADVLNKALFGLTAKEWREKNLKNPGNLRDLADVTQLVCLANLESLNAEFIRQGIPQSERLLKLNQIAIIQMKSLVDNPAVKKLK